MYSHDFRSLFRSTPHKNNEGCNAYELPLSKNSDFNLRVDRGLQSNDTETCVEKWGLCTSSEETCGNLICSKPRGGQEVGVAAEASSCDCLLPAAKNMADLHYLMLAAFFVARSNYHEGCKEDPLLDLLKVMPYGEKIPDDAVMFGDSYRLCLAMDQQTCDYVNDRASQQTYGTAVDLFDTTRKSLIAFLNDDTSGRRLDEAEACTSAPSPAPTPGTAPPTTCVVSSSSGFDWTTSDYKSTIEDAYDDGNYVFGLDMPSVPWNPSDALEFSMKKLGFSAAEDSLEDVLDPALLLVQCMDLEFFTENFLLSLSFLPNW